MMYEKAILIINGDKYLLTYNTDETTVLSIIEDVLPDYKDDFDINLINEDLEVNFDSKIELLSNIREYPVEL